MKSIYISTTSFAEYSKNSLELLSKNKINFVLNDKHRKLSDSEVPIILKDYCGVIAGTESYSKGVLEKLHELKVISRLGVGLDNIDLKYAKINKIKVFRTNTTPAIAVGELALGLMIDILRKITYQNNLLKYGNWKKNMGSLLTNKTLGIIGLGEIGKTVIELTKGFNLKYLAWDKVQDDKFSKDCNVKYCGLNQLLSKSDVVSIHLNLSEETKDLITFDKIKQMKKEAILINTSRGEIIDELGLVKALRKDLIAGAGIDVFCDEPYNGPLIEFENVITTPHIASYAKETRAQMELEAVKNLLKGLKIG